jgi:hypothetical protein
MSVNQTTEPVNSEALGAVLFLKFYGLDTANSDSGSPHWARVDNIEVKAVKN